MATKSKNTNVIIKALAILLSVCFMTGAFHFVYQLADTCQYYDISLESFDSGNLKNKTLADTNYLASYFYEDIENIKVDYNAQDIKGISKFIEKNRDSLLSSFLAEYKQLQADYDVNPANNKLSDSNWIIDAEVSLNYRGTTVCFRLPEKGDNAVRINDDVTVASKKINNVIDNYISLKSYASLFDDYPERDHRADLKYLVVDNKNKVQLTNFEKGENKKNVLENKYAFTVINGKVTCTDALNGLFENYFNYAEDKDFDIYVFVDEEYGKELIGGNTFTAYINGALAARQRNPKVMVIGAAALFLLSLAAAVYALVVCGKRRENGYVKLAWIDYIPTDIHLALSGSAIGGLVVAVGTIISDSFSYYQNNELALKYLYYAVLALVALIWALFLEFATSFVRACKSEKHLYKNTLIYLVIKYIIVKPAAFILRKLKEFFAYKPENFKRSIARAAVLYGIINAVLMIAAFCGAAADFAPFCFAVAFLFFAFNIACAVFVIKYIIDLDKIIYAAKTKTVPAVNYEKLPQSLKVLADSIQYTKQELEAAVNQAVRDERMRTELITNVSHDLKTPLTSIITYVDLLKNCNIQDENATEYIAVLDEKGIRLKRLIDDLIEASKITSGVITLNPVQLSLSELGAQAVYERQQEFADNGLELVFKGDKGNVNAFADGNKTFRVIENLLSNAKKYSAKGSRVYCDVYETQNFSIFEIKNISAQPLDITPQELKERFVRGDKSRNNEGNGLGLSIADNLCKAQNGHLNITIDGDLFKAQVMLPKVK